MEDLEISLPDGHRERFDRLCLESIPRTRSDNALQWSRPSSAAHSLVTWILTSRTHGSPMTEFTSSTISPSPGPSLASLMLISPAILPSDHMLHAAV